MSFWRRCCILILLLSALRPAYADVHFSHSEDDDEPKWQEGEVTLPAFPREENLQEFYVSAATANHFYVDGKSIAVGSDGVVRYTLVVKTAGGATNTDFEGIRCGALETRLYAVGRSDGTWDKVRISVWRPIENDAINRPQAALSRDYFCPSMLPIRTPEEGRNALRRGGHPDAK